MFEPGSRYARLTVLTLTVTDPDGTKRDIRYVRRRIIPPADATTKVATHVVVQGDRIDNVAARQLGDPLQYWRICDANTVLNPGELTDEDEIGRVIDIGLAQS